jgi:glycosyltransferase involved in cell wall biosynthesis
MRKVLIAYKYVPQYRAPFFDQLRDKLAADDIELTLVYGDPTPSEATKKDASKLPWATYLPSRSFVIRGSHLLYQPFLRLSKDFDLIIVEQANRLLINPLLILLHRLGLRHVAYWGHGKNFQTREPGLARWLKNYLATNVGWWFAYNETSAKVVMELGYPSERITRVMNTIDNQKLANDLASVTDAEVEALRARMGIDTSNVCLYIGGMYDLKRLDFLFEALLEIKHRIPDFRMIFLGSGVDKHKAEAFVQQHTWCSFEGSRFGREKATYMKLGKLILMPGLVGLAIIDSFVAGLPIVTTDLNYHSPEIEYLQSGRNGVMVQAADDASAYAVRVSDLLQNDAALQKLREGCAASAEEYSMAQMVERFSNGIKEALAA